MIIYTVTDKLWHIYIYWHSETQHATLELEDAALIKMCKILFSIYSIVWLSLYQTTDESNDIFDLLSARLVESLALLCRNRDVCFIFICE